VLHFTLSGQNSVTWLIITGSGSDNWIYWRFYYNYNRLQQLTISDSPRLAPFLTGLRVSSLPTVTDLVLIYESDTSSAATASNDDCLTNESIFFELPLLSCSAYPWKLLVDFVDMESAFRTKSVFTNPHLASASRCLALDYSGFQASCHHTVCIFHITIRATCPASFTILNVITATILFDEGYKL
jgi:hypothetical protein